MGLSVPWCTTPIELGDVDADVLSALSSVECPNCGVVSLESGESTVRYEPAGIPSKRSAGSSLLSFLGKGSFGSVWLANDTSLDRQVAVKLAVAGREDMGLLLHEAQAAAKLKHPGIVAVYQVGVEDGQAYIASEYIEGLNLKDLLSTGKPTQARAVELVEEIARALQHRTSTGSFIATSSRPIF